MKKEHQPGKIQPLQRVVVENQSSLLYPLIFVNFAVLFRNFYFTTSLLVGGHSWALYVYSPNPTVMDDVVKSYASCQCHPLWTWWFSIFWRNCHKVQSCIWFFLSLDGHASGCLSIFVGLVSTFLRLKIASPWLTLSRWGTCHGCWGSG